MISGDFSHCQTLRQFYDEIVALQTKAHGADYCLHHAVIQTAIISVISSQLMHEPPHYEHRPPKCVYKELGVNQGATAAAAALAGAEWLHLVDVDLNPFRKNEHLFSDQIGTQVYKYEYSSLDSYVATIPCDVLFVDTVHTVNHVRAELLLHAPKTSSTIIIHDTGTVPEIHDVAVQTLAGKWDPIVHDRRGCGFSVFFKTSNK